MATDTNEDATAQVSSSATNVASTSTYIKSYAGISPCWTQCSNAIRRGIVVAVGFFSGHAARHPWAYVTVIPLLSTIVLVIGLLTNFHLTLDPEEFLIPLNNAALSHAEWLLSPQGFPDTYETDMVVLVHRNGDNVLTKKAARRAMQVVDALFETQGYQQVCGEPTFNYTDIHFFSSTNVPEEEHRQHTDAQKKPCWMYGFTRFWSHNSTTFDNQVVTDDDLRQQISAYTFPGGTPVAHEALFGNLQRDNNTTRKNLAFAQSYILSFALPDTPYTADLEYFLMENWLALREQWTTDPTNTEHVTLDFLTPLSLEEEVKRTILNDAYLIPIVVFLMTNFVALVFYQRDKVRSRWLLGYGAVITVGFSLMMGFGTMFILGVPVTSMVTMLPYVVFGIALDDTFIIVGSYNRMKDEELKEGISEQPRSVGNDDHGATVCNSNNSPDGQLHQEQEHDRIVKRIHRTAEDIGVSIVLTTITTVAAFLLSGSSSIPSIRWLGWYAAWTIFVDFFFQITFFVSLLVLDERRIQANRRDVCFWIIVDKDENSDDLDIPKENCVEHTAPRVETASDEGGGIYSRAATQVASSESSDSPQSDACRSDELRVGQKNIICTDTDYELKTKTSCADEQHAAELGPDNALASHVNKQQTETNQHQSEGRQLNFAERAMNWYSTRVVLKKWFQCIVLVVFLSYAGLCAYATTRLTMEWKVQDFIEDDSYVSEFIAAMYAYVPFTTRSAVYFRHVNQSDPQIQQQMLAFIDNVTSIEQVGGNTPVPFCWVTDFAALENLFGLPSDENTTFVQKLDYALSIPAFTELYADDIVRDQQSGEIVASRCWFMMSNLDFDDVGDQLSFYEEQAAVSAAQPINANRRNEADQAFFTFDYLYFVWEFFNAIERELTISTISGVVAVSVIGFVLIPHWTAILYMLPLIVILYVDVMGSIYFMGLHIESMTFVSIIVSIGLLVDFLMHVLLRYYETPGRSREQKVQGTLQTMGASIFVGGLSTFLGILPLALGTSMIMRTVFLCFLAMVVLGVSHGLVFLPVVLALTGPVNQLASSVPEDAGTTPTEPQDEVQVNKCEATANE